MRRFLHLAPLTTLLVTLAFAGTGCSSSGRAPESEKAVEGFQKTRAALARAQGQVDHTNAALDRLAAGGDLQKSFKNYTESVSDLEKSAQGARKRAETMRDNVQEYTARWQKEIETMQDPSIRAGLAARRQAVSDNFEAVRASAHDAREAYEPYVAGLNEIRRALAIDLTPQNATVLKPAIDKSKQQGQVLKQKLAAMQSELENITRSTSPAGATRAQ